MAQTLACPSCGHLIGTIAPMPAEPEDAFHDGTPELDRLVSEFVEERCHIDASASTRVIEMYAALDRWCHARRVTTPSSKRLNRSLSLLPTVTVSRSPVSRRYDGIGLRHSEDRQETSSPSHSGHTSSARSQA